MIDGNRLKELLKLRALSQSELARRVEVSQATIFKLISGESFGSKHLHRIARELQTSPEFLTGETDNADPTGPLPPPPSPTLVTMAVAFPPERALAQMFEALLAGIDPSAPQAEQALLLAQRLPIGLSQLRDLRHDPDRPASSAPARAKAAAPRARRHREPTS